MFESFVATHTAPEAIIDPYTYLNSPEEILLLKAGLDPDRYPIEENTEISPELAARQQKLVEDHLRRIGYPSADNPTSSAENTSHHKTETPSQAGDFVLSRGLGEAAVATGS